MPRTSLASVRPLGWSDVNVHADESGQGSRLEVILIDLEESEAWYGSHLPNLARICGVSGGRDGRGQHQ
jgi:hypothetical protein